MVLGTSIPQELMPPRQIAQGRHERWSTKPHLQHAGRPLGGWITVSITTRRILNFILILFYRPHAGGLLHQLNMKKPVRADSA